MPPRNYLAIAGAGLLTAACCWGHTVRSQADSKDDMLELYGQFVDAVERVEANYVRPVDRKELLESALRGMLADLDPHSSYFSEAEWGQFRKQIEGTFTGIGVSVEIDERTGQLKVLAPLPGSPAYAAGVLPGDLILEVDGKPTEGMTRDKAVEALQGRPGTSVTLKVRHPMSSEPETLTIGRAIIELPSVIGDARKPDDSWNYLIDPERKIGYVRITNFVQNTAQELEAALGQLQAEGMKGLVIDLRDDPGGLLSAAVEVVDLFLKEGKVVTTKGRNQRDKTFEAEARGPYEDLPLAILINQHSASASEIVSAALQDHGRASIVGQRSYGKGSVQNILPLDNGQTILKLTVASYWRPNGHNIHRFKGAKESDEWGVKPDDGLEVKLSPAEYEKWAEARRRRDLISRLNPADAAKDDAPKAIALHQGIDDAPLDKALDVVARKIAEQGQAPPAEEPKAKAAE
jgi:carboxyl-terminal processing protease